MPAPLTERRRKEITSLTQRKYRERLGQMLVEGLRSVEAAVDAQAPLVDLVVAENLYADPQTRLLLERVEAPVYRVAEHELAHLSDVQTSQGIVAVASIDLTPEAGLHQMQTLLVLDAVQDPGNVGTIIRTAAWFGVDAVAAGPGAVDLFNPKVVRAAMGGLWDVRLARTDDLVTTLAALKQAGFRLYGADLEGTSLPSVQPRTPSALILGSEAHGLSPQLTALLDERVFIPGNPRRQGTESLNVAVAAGILMNHWMPRK